ncbi:hypothetical protein LAZ40_21830 [Cereibacter sphaeroides]|uniref:hypothetical protein n=1 Tax=Rhodobacterales TaxID=204455 RepID=UPI0012FDC970|nr:MULTISPECIES: hypothetical protein [Paracoccaceae]MCE6961676.1 hypothetical protein [Cereibacter sphaeroides]MCE6968063.1 hypothetical protein [Cereibacter sphaeroides]MCE6975026.1 hypothetical protein [Cereibacter sphaeroides]
MRKPEHPLEPETALQSAVPASGDDRRQRDGTIRTPGSCEPRDSRNGPEAMFSYMQDDQGEALVNRHVEDNLRRAYDLALPEAMDDRFAVLLGRIASKQARQRSCS